MKKQNRKAIARQRRRDIRRLKRKAPTDGNAYVVQRLGWMSDRIESFFARFAEQARQRQAREECILWEYKNAGLTSRRVDLSVIHDD